VLLRCADSAAACPAQPSNAGARRPTSRSPSRRSSPPSCGTPRRSGRGLGRRRIGGGNGRLVGGGPSCSLDYCLHVRAMQDAAPGVCRGPLSFSYPRDGTLQVVVSTEATLPLGLAPL